MMKKLGLMMAIVAAQAAFAASPLLITDRIDARKVVEGIPVAGHLVLKSGDNRVKQLWSIKGYEFSRLEIIGNNQKDADQVSLRCMVFDKNGASISPVPAESPCHRLFVKLLSKFTSTPDAFARLLIEESARTGQTEGRRLDDFSLEADGEFYAVRRWSRMRH